MTAFRLPRLPQAEALIDLATGRPTQKFQQWWQALAKSLETQEGNQTALLEGLTAVNAAVETVEAAVVTVETAVSTVETAVTTVEAAVVSVETTATAAETLALDVESRITAFGIP